MIKPFLPFIKSYLIDPKLYHSLVLNWLPRNNIGSEGFAYKIIFCSTVLWSNGRQYWKRFNCSESSYFNMNLSSQTGSCLPVNMESIWHENFFFFHLTTQNYLQTNKLLSKTLTFIKITDEAYSRLASRDGFPRPRSPSLETLTPRQPGLMWKIWPMRITSSKWWNLKPETRGPWTGFWFLTCLIYSISPNCQRLVLRITLPSLLDLWHPLWTLVLIEKCRSEIWEKAPGNPLVDGC